MILFDTETRERIGEYQAGTRHFVTWLGFHPRDGSLAIVGGADPSEEPRGYLHVIDPATQRLRSSVWLPGHPAERAPYWPTATYAPDERSVIVAYMSLWEPRTPVPLFLRRFGVRTGSPIGPAVRVGPAVFRPGLLSTPDGRLLVASHEAIYAIDTDTLRVVRRYPVGAFSTLSAPTAPRSRSAARTEAFACSTSPPGGCGP